MADRPLRYRGRLNRRGRNAVKMYARRYGEWFDSAIDAMEARTSTWRGLMDRKLEDEFRG